MEDMAEERSWEFERALRQKKQNALIELCAQTVESEKLCDEDVEADRDSGGAKEDEAYNMAIRHAASSVRALLTQTLHWDGDKWILRR